MTRDDTEKLFELLAIYFPNNQKARSKTQISAWHLLLEPYATDTVRQAVVEQLRENVNFPDPQKIAVRCEYISPREKKIDFVSDKLKRSESVRLRLVEEYHQRLRKGLTDCGVPDYDGAGVPYAKWRKEAEEAGIRFDLVLEEAMEATREWVKDRQAEQGLTLPQRNRLLEEGGVWR